MDPLQDTIVEKGYHLAFRKDGDRLFLEGAFTLPVVQSFLKRILPYLKKREYAELHIDLEGIEQMDSAGVSALQYIDAYCKRQDITCHLENGSEPTRKKIELFWHEAPPQKKGEGQKTHFEVLGENVYRIFTRTIPDFFFLTVDILYWSVVGLFKKKHHRKGETVNQAVLIGVNAVTIVGSLSFIIGLVLALQSAAQLRNFGANIYIVDLTVIAMMREMGPLITAILVAGRSGSSVAAEIATMKVTSELDALTTMALNPIRFVVVPKVYGAVITMPFLTILANVMGILGGMVVGYVYLDLSPEVFFNRMSESLYNRDIVISIVKSLIFVLLIILTGSYYGFNVEEGAEGVGKSTTMAVVVSIALVIVADSILGLIFY
jgi:phospholipid/cholesterol/gamma-HCH transport system permease protein